MNLEGTHIKVTVKVYKKKSGSFLLSNKLGSGAKLGLFWKVVQSLYVDCHGWPRTKTLGCGTTKAVNFGPFSTRFHVP